MVSGYWCCLGYTSLGCINCVQKVILLNNYAYFPSPRSSNCFYPMLLETNLLWTAEVAIHIESIIDNIGVRTYKLVHSSNQVESTSYLVSYYFMQSAGIANTWGSGALAVKDLKLIRKNSSVDFLLKKEGTVLFPFSIITSKRTSPVCIYKIVIRCGKKISSLCMITLYSIHLWFLCNL